MRALLLVVALVGSPPAPEAQQVLKPWRLGWLSAGVARPELEEPFRTALRALGYIEGQNLVVEYRYSKGTPGRLPQLASELVKLGPDVIVAISNIEVRALKGAGATMPIVGVLMSEPIMREFVTTLARPGGNVTGLTHMHGPELYGKRLEVLRELVPDAARIGLLINPDGALSTSWVDATRAAARALGVDVRVFEARTPEELPGAFAVMKQHRIQALRVPTDPLFNGARVRLVELAARARIPVLYDLRDFVDAGGLASYGPSFRDLFSRAAFYVDRVLKGQKPGDLAIEEPTKFELVVNRKAANTLGLKIPASFLIRADHVIE